MEVREAIGRRRSIRFLLPHKPVELDKIQRMLEAARIASHWGNVSTLRAIVIQRDKADKEVLAALPPPVAGYLQSSGPIRRRRPEDPVLSFRGCPPTSPPGRGGRVDDAPSYECPRRFR